LVLFVSFNARAEVMEKTLSNGLQIILKKDKRAPVVTSHIWYKIGSADEVSGKTGLSHALEHMMFKGTKKNPKGLFSSVIAKLGGRENAFTSKDYTAYYQTLPSQYLEEAIRLESDRMTNLVINEEDFLKEIEVIKEERRLRTDDQPEGIAYEQLYASAYNNSSYHDPIIGWMEDLNNMSYKDISDWYKNWYAPNNATIVIVGDIDFDKTFRLVEKYYGTKKRMGIKERILREEPKQFGEKVNSIKIDGKPSYLITGYKVPSINNENIEKWECYALSVLSGILSSGQNSRLQKVLIKEKKIASYADSGYSMFSRQDPLLMIDVNPMVGVGIDLIENELQNLIEDLQTNLVNKKELDRIKAQVLATEIYQRDSIDYQARILGMIKTSVGSIKVIDEYTSNINAITAQQVREVAKKYLVENLKTTVTVNNVTKQ
jgi:zinc protease|tara:strand:- start:15104 stop:16399 length:1296 start_codon:yes stop_codon:yes gene_type:complete